MDITFRPLTEDDLPLLHRWLNEPGVVEWWEGDDVSWEAVVRDYWSEVDDHTEHWLGVLDAGEIGWIQCYPIAEEPEERDDWWALGVDRTAAGIDYLLGEPGRRGQGLGSAMIAAFVEQVVFGRHPSWTQVCASPYAANRASCRALEKAGFTAIGIIEDPEGPCQLLGRLRPPAGSTATAPNR